MKDKLDRLTDLLRSLALTACWDINRRGAIRLLRWKLDRVQRMLDEIEMERYQESLRVSGPNE